jgi:glycosyltransferase involved in cell wall biosynthesis
MTGRARHASDEPAPLVSIILPTFNRARLLPEAFESIRTQSWERWELIVVDDGSTDDTAAVVRECTRAIAQKVEYVHHANKGAYGARNTGLDHAAGEYVAFFDSDDLWLPEYLERCVNAFEAAPEVDWVFAACRSVDETGAIIQPTTFETDLGPRPFLFLKTKDVGALRIIDDPMAIECHLLNGIYCGLQNSVIRRDVFAGHRFWEGYRVVEDVFFLTRALARGIRLAYLANVQVVYRIHGGNSSGSAAGLNREAFCRIRRESILGLERLQQELALTPRQQRALRRSLSRHYFWDIGYVCCWEANDIAGAFAAFNHGLRLDPFDGRMWKTYASCLVRSVFRRTVRTQG